MAERRQPEITTYNRQQFFRLIEGLRGFRSLVAILDLEAALSVASLVFDNQIHETNPDDHYILLANRESDRYPARIDKLLQTECDQIREKRIYVVELLQAAQAGKLRPRLTNMTEPEANYTHQTSSPAGASPEREVAKAAGWVGHSIHGDGWSLAAAVLAQHTIAAPSGTALGRTPKLLDHVHANIAGGGPRVRGPNAETAYPSSVGGRYLLELLFELTAGSNWPPPGDDRWLDAALFYLGAVTTVQGYPDGNKRVGRMAYAITLLKGGRPFVAPNPQLEAELVRMTRAAPD